MGSGNSVVVEGSAELRFSVLELKCQWLIAQHLEMGDWSSQERLEQEKFWESSKQKWQVNQESSCMHMKKVASIAGSRGGTLVWCE